MAFTSFTYLYFLAIVVALYWVVRGRIAQNVLLVVASYVFYGWLTPWYCVLLAASTLVTYGCLHILWRTPEGQAKGRWPVVMAIGVNIGMLAVLKYWNFWLDDIVAAATELGWDTSKSTLSIALPLGLSFYTLQAVGLVVDAHRGDVQRQPLLNVALFLAFFPKLISGPFEKAKEFMTTAATDRTCSAHTLESGIALMMYGFFKKLVVADGLGPYLEQILHMPEPPLTVIAATSVGFCIQILADFSGYTDIARGSARLFGIQLMENFRYPYLAISPSDFWRRWHISLSSWFRDYVYIPMGGSHSPQQWRIFAAITVTMGASGVWHGATAPFLLWGLYYGILLYLYQVCGLGGKWNPGWLVRIIAWAIMTCLTLLGWIIFKAPSAGWLLSLVTAFPAGGDAASLTLALTWLTLAGIFGGMWSVFATLSLSSARPLRIMRNVGLVTAIVFLAQEQPIDFLYFQF